MKTLLRIFVVLFVLLIIALLGGYFVLTDAGFQKKLVESQLPAGSSIESIHVTTGQVTLSGLVLMLEDGTRVQVGSLDTAFEPLAAAFDQTIKMGVLQVEGLRVDLPKVVAPRSLGGGASSSAYEPQVESAPTTPMAGGEGGAMSPMEVLAAIGDFEWLLDVEGINLEGVIYDGQGSQYIMRVDAPAIRPRESSKVEASLQLLANAPLPSGLKTFDSIAALRFKQKIGGGFESLRFESTTSGQDAQGSQLVTVQQQLDLEVDDATGIATVSVDFDAELPKPQVLVPELATLGALKVTGNTVASTDGKTLTVSAADLVASTAGAELLALTLKHAMIFGGQSQELSGELLDVTVSALQFEWLNPWLGGIQLESQAPVSLSLSIAGAADGVFSLTSAEPITLGPLTVMDAEVPLVQDLIVTVDPQLEWAVGQPFHYTLHSLNVADTYGAFIQGRSAGEIHLDVPRDPENPFAGVESVTSLQIGLQELFQLPVLAGRASIVNGQLALELKVDGSADEPLQLAAQLSQLRARSRPTMARNYDIALALAPTSNLGEWELGAKLFAGPSSRPSTDVEFKAVVNPNVEPITFDADLSSPQVSQQDLSILSAALTPREPAELSASPSRPSRVRGAPKANVPVSDVEQGGSAVPPPWALAEGRAAVRVDAFRLEIGQTIEDVVLKVEVSEPKLSVDPVSAKMGEGKLKGSAHVLYTASQLKPYTLTSNIHFKDIDPSFFVKPYESVPVQGQFNGVFEFSGVGEGLDAAVEDSMAHLKITGEDGVLIAFEMDERQQLGLGLAGLLGQSLDRPGVTAVSNTIPYFKEIPFDHFVFELTRGADKQVRIPQLRLTGASVLVDANGSVGASALSEVMDQPLDVTLVLGAKGRLTEHLKVLDLLQPVAADDGFYHWKETVPITGTLADPDTGALMDILNDAGKRALSKPNTKQDLAEQDTSSSLTPESGTKKQSKEERRLEDVGHVLDALNSFF